MARRNLIKMFILHGLTLGFYRVYWLFLTRAELVAKGHKLPPIKIFIALYGFVFLTITLFAANAFLIILDQSRLINDCLAIGTTLKDCSDQVSSSYQYGDFFKTLRFLFYLATLIIYPLLGLWYWPYAKAVAKTTKNKLSARSCLLVLMLIPDGFDMLFIQAKLNKVPKSKTTTA